MRLFQSHHQEIEVEEIYRIRERQQAGIRGLTAVGAFRTGI